MVRISAFSDEVADDFHKQVEFLSRERIGYMEIRFVNGKNIMDLTRTELRDVKDMLGANGIRISAIGSPIGKVRLDTPFEEHLDKFKRALELAVFLEAPFVRVFSYYAPDGKSIDDYREEVVRRMKVKSELLKGSKIVLMHENEAHIYGHSAQNCADLARTVHSPNLRLAYDPANFVWGEGIANNMEICWPLMQPYVEHVHIKDWKAGSRDIGSMPGEGDGQIRELLEALARDRYEGFITMEPHLESGGQFGGKTGPSLYSRAIAAVRKLCKEAGLEYDVI